ncbi:CLEC-50 protein [Aphelenchoides avenae]|nr:CLEC-50 protein [Aphelenchus avenae]
MKVLHSLLPLALCAVAVTAANYCPPDAFMGPTHKDCYTFGQAPLSHDESDTICAMDGGHLASVSNAFQNAVLGKVSAAAKADYYRLGGVLVGGKWTWSDGTAFTYTNWKKGQPDNTKGSCLAIDRSGSWLVVDCAAPADYFCKVPPVTVPFPEVTTATTPSPEVICGAKRWTYVPETGKCYRVVRLSGSWDDQSGTCNEFDGTFVSIHSGAEAVALEQFVQRYDYDARKRGYYIGLHDPTGLGLWQWADGTPFDFENWGPGEPAKSGQKCVLAAKGLTDDPVDPVWTTVACDDDEFQGAAICQIIPGQH